MLGRLMLTLVVCAVLAGCSSQPSEELSIPGKVATSGEMEARLTRIEQDLLSLRMESDRQLATLRGDIESLRKQMKELSVALNGCAGKDELDNSAREFARESLQRMLDLSKKIMDRLEKELEDPTDDPSAKPDEFSPETDKTL